MTWELSEDHEFLRKVVRGFAENEVAPHAAEWDRNAAFPLDAVRALGDLGMFGIVFPEEIGGGGGDFTSFCVALEELGRVDQSLAVTMSVSVGLSAKPIYRDGAAAQQERFLPDLIAGRTIGAFGLTEPDAGSDAGATRTRAVLEGDEWVINGEKAFITNSGTAITSVITVTARTDDGISAFLVPAGTPGLEVLPSYSKLGWHASDTHGLKFDDCRIPADSLLGAPGNGFRMFLRSLDEGRISIAAIALGCARGALAMSIDYAKERQAFGGSIGRFQGVAFELAELAVKVENAANLTYKAAWLSDQGRPIGQAASMAKLYATETAVDAVRLAIQVHGGLGFLEDTPLARHYRDSKVLEIVEGTSQIQRMVIARHLGLGATT